MITAAEAFARITLTDDESIFFRKAEAAIDAALNDKFEGTLRLDFAQAAPPRVAYGLQRKYEMGGWRVSVALGTDSFSLSFVPAPGSLATIVPVEEKKLPPIVSAGAAPEARGAGLLVRMPTRGRPLQALSVLEKYRTMAACPVQIEVVLNADDESMLAADVMQRLSALGCVITVGNYKNKVEACNGGRVNDWDVLLLASDDMVPVAGDYGLRVLGAMATSWPYLDGAVFFDDGLQGADLCTLPIMGRRFWELCGRAVYRPSYKSLFCDTEQTELWKSMGKLVYYDQRIIEHRHPAAGKANKDELYERNDALWDVDQRTFNSRREMVRPHSQFRFHQPPLWLSICIASLPERQARLERLVDHLYEQINDGYSLQVEILVDSSSGVVGDKRQHLLERARGHFVAFVDDDDWVSHDYVERIVGALMEDPDADCATLVGVMTTAGQVPERFEHSLENNEWYTEGGTHLRTPNHLNAVRRQLALKVGFPSMQHAEDYDFSRRLRPLLKRQTSTGSAPLYYYWYWPGPETPRQ